MLRTGSIALLVRGGFLLLLVLFSLSALTNLFGAFSISEQSRKLVNEIQPALVAVGEIDAGLLEASAAMGNYLLTQEPAYREAARAALTRAESTVDQLGEHGSDTARIREELKPLLKRFAELQSQLLGLATDPQTNLPALAFSAREMGPLNQQILQLLTQMILSEQQSGGEGRGQLVHTLNDIRYQWSNLGSSVRAYLAFRNSETLNEIKQYQQSVDELLARLKSMRGLLEIDQEESYEQLVPRVGEYRGKLERMVAIHSGDSWRRDAELIRGEVGPLLSTIHQQIERLIAIQQQVAREIEGGLISTSESSLWINVVALII